MRATQFFGKLTIQTIRLMSFFLLAALCFAPRLALGQANGSPKSSRTLWNAEARLALDRSIFYGSVDRITGRPSTIGQLQHAKGLIFVSPSRGRTSSVESRSLGTNFRPASSSPHQTLPPAVADTYTNGAATGLWNNAGNWSAGLPGVGNDVFITGGGAAASVAQDVSATINNLNLNAGNSWTLNNSRVLTIMGTSISNAGSMTLNSTGNFTELVIGANVTLGGGGTVTMSNNANNFIFGTATGNTLTNQETIQGSGNIGDGQMTLVNSGTIDANQSVGLTIQANGSGTANTGTIKATGGPLTFSGTTVANAGGTISDSGGNTLKFLNSTVNGGAVTLVGASTLQLSNGTIHGGSTLTNSATGVIEALSGTNTLGGTINNPAGGQIKIDNAAVLNLENGAYPTLGSVALNSTGNFTELVLTGANVTLSGGSVTMSNNANNFIFGTASGNTLTNQETIQGSGNIGDGQMTLVNSGTIDANQSVGLTVQVSGGVTNTGTIRATGGPLTFTNTTVANAGGTISDSGGNTLKLSNSTVNGGAVTLAGASTLQLSNGTIHSGSTLTNSATGVIEAFSGTNTLGGTINNPAGGQIKIDNGVFLNLENGSYPNLGSVTLNSTGNVTELLLPGANVTLSGGSVTMSNNANNYIFGTTSGNTLTNQETIQGAGNIGNGQMTLVNSGTINANQSAGLTIQASGGVTNTGAIQDTGGPLTFINTTVANAGGTISDSGGNTLKLSNSTVNGGAVTVAGASTLQLSNGTIHGGSTLTNSATGVIEAFSGTNTLGGTINNPAGGQIKIDNGVFLNLENGSYPNLGSVTLNSTGNVTELLLPGANVTLSGGSVTMSNNANNYIFGTTSGNTLTNQETIQGAGNIGNGQMTLVNSGTINANQSAGLTIQASGGVTNTGAIQDTGGPLTFFSTTVANAGGTISDTGNTLKLTNSTVNGGAVTLAGASTLQLSNGIIHGGSTLTNSATGVIEAFSGVNTLGGTINNAAGGQIKIDNGVFLNLENGAYPNLGTVTLNSTGSVTELVVNGANVTLSGGGVTMSNNANNYILGAATADTLTNQETIQGSGHIGNGVMTLVNPGIINANQSAGLTIQVNGGITNTGTIEATGGPLAFSSTTVANAGGTVSANGNMLQMTNTTINGGAVTLAGASTLQLWNGVIHAGSTLNNSATGTIEALAGVNTLGGTINNGAGGVVKIDNGAVLNLENGSYPNLGPVTLNSTGSVTELLVGGANVTLSGGSVTMSNNANNYIFGAATADTLTNQETIQGSGHIGNGVMTLVNPGIINANQSAGMTIQVNGGITNTGTIEATGGPVAFSSTTVANAGGTVSANGNMLQMTNTTINGGAVTLAGASTLQLWNGVIHAGSTLNNSATGTIEALAGVNTLGGTINNGAGGVVKIDNGAVLNLENGSYPNLGPVTLNSTGSVTELLVGGANVTLSGGSVTMSNNANNYIFGAATADTLTNQETIQGAGNIGNSVMTLVNSGIINANQSAGMTIQVNGGVTNTGTIEATGGALTLNGTTVTNTGGTISDTGKTLALINSTINGGAVTLAGASTLQLTNGVIHGGSTLTNSATGVIESLTGTNTLGGTINNPAGGLIQIDNATVLKLENGVYPTLGSVAVNSTGSFTELLVNGANVTLSGGSVTMSNNANNLILGAAGADILTNQELIQGAGTIGNGTMGLVNSGTILANQSTPLIINTSSSGFNNPGTLAVSSGDTLQITTNTPFQNFAGTTLTGGTYNVAGTLQFGLAGTKIVTNAANITLTGAGHIFDISNGNVLSSFNTNAVGSNFGLAGGANFTTPGNFTNSGTLTVASGSTFDVSGNLTNFSGNTLSGGTYNLAGTLQFTGANIVNNSANITLTGTAGRIIDQASANGLANLATNNAGASFTINGGANFTTVGAFANAGNLTVGNGSTFNGTGNYTNTGTSTVLSGGIFNEAGTLTSSTAFINGGTLEAIAGKTLDLKSPVTNTGGTILATGTGAKVLLDGKAITGGTLTTALGGAMFGINSATLNGSTSAVTLSTGSALQIINGQTLKAVGSIINNGTVSLGSTGTNTQLLLAGNTSLTGTGTVTLSNNAANIITGTAGTVVLNNANTIQGAGNIGNGVMGLVNFKTILANQTTPLIINTSTSGFNNKGTLTVNNGSTLQITGGPFQNFVGTTLTGGAYSVIGTLQFNGANIITNAANITLAGLNSKIVDQSNVNGLLNFATNASTGAFTLAGNQNLTTAGGSFSNAGTLTVKAGSTLTVGNGGNLTIPVNYTQTGGITTVDGTLTSSASNIAPTLNLNGGSLFGTGTVGYGVIDAGAMSPGDQAKVGAMSVAGTYTVNPTGALSIAIGGTTAGTQFDQLNVTSTANLNGTLNVSLVNGFVPTLGSQFEILNSSALTGTFATVTGLGINGSEHFDVTYNGNDVILTVVSGPAAASSITTARANRSLVSSLRPPMSGAGPNRFGNGVPRDLSRTFNRYPVQAFRMPNMSPSANRVVRSPVGVASTRRPALASLRNPGRPDRKRLEFGVDLLSLLGTSPRNIMRAFGPAGFANPNSLGYVNYGYR